jgi:beta-lactamase superfamily II metal-dependent hydrolase
LRKVGDTGDFSPLQTLSNRGVEWLDAVVITHPHRDHLDDIFNFKLLAPRSLWRPRHLSEADIRNGNRAMDTNVIDEYLRIDRAYGGLRTNATNITVPATLTDATIQIFGGNGSCSTDNLNNHSLVVIAS